LLPAPVPDIDNSDDFYFSNLSLLASILSGLSLVTNSVSRKMSNPTPQPPLSFNVRIIQHKDDPTEGQAPQEVGVDCSGQETKPADWRTAGAFIGDGNEPLGEQQLAQMIPIYENTAYGTPPEQTSKPNKLWLSDDPELTDTSEDKPTSPFQKYGWQPVTISIEPNKKKKHEKWKTKKRVLDIEEMETEQCPLWDPRVDSHKPKIVSYFKRSGNPVFGDSFAPPISFEFRGFTEALGLCCLATSDTAKQKRTIEWVLNQYGGLSADEHCVDAIKHTIRGKLKYQVRIQGVAAGLLCGKGKTGKYKQFPIDFVFEYNNIDPTTEMYEEVELVYYTNISVSVLEG
jgi:hypothetical protein